MTWWPGWDTAESAGAWANCYFWLGIFALILLGAFELISHRYSLRKDELVAVAESHLAAERAAKDRHSQIITAKLVEQLAAAEKVAAQTTAQDGAVKQLTGQRHLTEAQKQELFEAIAPFDGQPIAIDSLLDDTEGRLYRDDFVELFRKAGWSIEGHVGEMHLDTSQTGVVVAMDKDWVNAGHKLPNAGIALITALSKLNIIPAKNLTLIGNLPPGRLVLVVGNNPK